MEVLELKIEDLKEHGTYAVSLVESPAMEEDLNKIFLSSIDETVELQMTSQGMVYGIAMIPNKQILRQRPDGTKYKIFASEDTIRENAHLFFSRLQNNNATVGHEEAVQDVSFVESWIITDEKNDKAVALGLNAVKGAWVLGAKINNPQVKEDIKLGKYKGFSIEAKFKHVKAELSKEQTNKSINMKDGKRTFMNEVRVFLGMEVKFEALKNEAGDTTFVAEAFETGYSVGIQNEDGTIVPVPASPDGYVLSDGRTMMVEQEGIIASIAEAKPAEEPAAMDDTPNATPAAEPAPATPKRVVESVSKEMFFEAVKEVKETLAAEFEQKLEALKVELSKVEPSAVELEKQKEVKPLEPNVMLSAKVEKPYEQMTNKEKALFNRGKF